MSQATRMPAIFFGHGSPMNALHTNAYTRAWAAIGAEIPRPRAILCISAHWYIPETAVTAMDAPRTIHDFGRFPQELFAVRYPAPGDPRLAGRVREVLKPVRVAANTEWGLDHGTWSVLCHVYPKADVPVVQLGMDATKPAAFHYELGRRLRVLRDEGILVMATGNVVHNLHTYAWGNPSAEPLDWAVRFDARVRELIAKGEHGPLIDFESMGGDAALSVPTPEHYLPLLYVLGAAHEEERASFPMEGITGGSLSMLTLRMG